MTRNNIGLLVVTSMLIVACSGSDVPAPDVLRDDEVFAEKRGSSLSATNLNTFGALAWEHPTEIMFTSFNRFGGESHIRAVRLSDNVERVVDGPRPAATRYGAVTVSPDGSQIYFTAGGQPSLYHIVPGAAAVLIAERSTAPASARHSQYGVAVLPSPDSRRAAYVVFPDSVRLYDAETKSSRALATGCIGLMEFSPDGQQLLCRKNAELFVVNVAAGSVRPFPLPGGRSINNLISASWSVRGVSFIFYGSGGLTELVDAESGAAATIFNSGHFADFEFLNVNPTWSRDGKKVAFSTSRCVSLDCPKPQGIVYVYGTESRQLDRIAVITFTKDSGSRIERMVFSPDGARLAYAAGTLEQGSLYVATVP